MSNNQWKAFQSPATNVSYVIMDEKDEIVCTIAKASRTDQKANAELISKTPELVQLLKKIHEICIDEKKTDLESILEIDTLVLKYI